ncbi:hypothetical protein WJX74_007927 [Apatococcus lobatus]|uniref:DUF924-domain-containing protein n=1 Tax=Apatococcus lobatus TaxID=904363 RepID=A0AAW1S1Y3_9CHLO
MLSSLLRPSTGLLNVTRLCHRGSTAVTSVTKPSQTRAFAALTAGADKPLEVHHRADSILTFWCGEDYRQQTISSFPSSQVNLWYGGGQALDQEIKQKFASDVEAAAAGRYNEWIDSSFNGLALMIIMDQFTRNMYRNTPKAYALDRSAVKLARAMLASGNDKQLIPLQRHWIYTPFQHSELLEDQQDSVQLHEGLLKESQESVALARIANATGFIDATQITAGRHQQSALKETEKVLPRANVLAAER